MDIQTSDIVPVIIIFQSALFAFVLFTDQGPKRTSNRFLATFLLVLGIQFIAITSTNLNIESAFLDASLCVYGFIYGPVLYFYTRTLVYRTFHFRLSQLLHLIPAASFLFFAAIHRSLCRPFGALIYLSLITYIILIVKLLSAYRKVLQDTRSSSTQIDLIWLQWITIIFCFTLLVDIVNQYVISLSVLGGISSIHLAILILINWIFYKGLKQPQIFLGISKSEEMLTRNTSNPLVLVALSEDEKEEFEQVRQYMQSSKAYTNADLSLTELAKRLDIQPRKLSFLINNMQNKNFMGFVNDYRIEMAKDRLMNVSERGETILEIMYDVGFNSKSSFNTLFKQNTGLTPSDFRKKHMKL